MSPDMEEADQPPDQAPPKVTIDASTSGPQIGVIYDPATAAILRVVVPERNEQIYLHVSKEEGLLLIDKPKWMLGQITTEYIKGIIASITGIIPAQETVIDSIQDSKATIPPEIAKEIAIAAVPEKIGAFAATLTPNALSELNKALVQLRPDLGAQSPVVADKRSVGSAKPR